MTPNNKLIHVKKEKSYVGGRGEKGEVGAEKKWEGEGRKRRGGRGEKVGGGGKLNHKRCFDIM